MTVSEITNSSTTVQWEMVPCIHQNGDITGYRVQYGAVGGIQATVSVSGGDVAEATITGLSPSTNYFVRVAAVNDAGTGVFSSSIHVDTPGIIANKSGVFKSSIGISLLHCAVAALVLSVSTTTATMIALSWTSGGSEVTIYQLMWQRNTSLECPYEDVGYNYTYADFTEYTITGLEEDSSYNITLIAIYNDSIVISNNVTAMTLEAGESYLHK